MKTDDDYAEQDAYMRMQDASLSEARLSASTRIMRIGDASQRVAKLYWQTTLPYGTSTTKELVEELYALAVEALRWAHELEKDDGKDDRPEAA